MSRAGPASSRGSGQGSGAGGVHVIPASARKIVQSLKEIVPNTEEDIYAALKECNMDPNETVQRLLNQDPFHEVKRRRDKKREGGGNKDGPGRAPGAGAGRGGRGGSMADRGLSRGSFTSRADGGSGRGKSMPSRENGIHSSSRFSSPATGAPNSWPVNEAPHTLQSTPYFPPVQSSISYNQAPLPTDFPSSSSVYSRPSSGTTGWGSGTTMADIVKANGAPPPQIAPQPQTQPGIPEVPPFVSDTPPFDSSSSSFPPPGLAESGLYSSSLDPVLHPSLDHRASAAPGGSVKRDVGIVGPQRPIGERPAGLPSPDVSTGLLQRASVPASGQGLSPALSVQSDSNTFGSEAELEANVPDTQTFSGTDMAPPPAQDQPASLPGYGTSSYGQVHAPVQTAPAVPSRPAPIPVGSHLSSRPSYAPQQPTGASKVPLSGGAQDWNPKPMVQSSLASSTDPASISSDSRTAENQVGGTAARLGGLTLQEEKPVTMPGHLQVAEESSTHLSFGSFGAGFTSNMGGGFGHENGSITGNTSAGGVSHLENTIDSSSSVSAPTSAPSNQQTYSHQQSSVPIPEPTAPPTEPGASTPSHQESVKQQLLEVPLQQSYQSGSQAYHQSSQQQPQTGGQQGSQHLHQAAQQGQQTTQQQLLQQQVATYPYGLQTYPGFGLMPQLQGGQYPSYDSQEVQGGDLARLASMAMPYSDQGGAYGQSYRPGTEGEARYSSYASSSSAKYGTSGATGSASQTSLQEGVSNLGAGPSQSSQAGNTSLQSAPSLPQQQQQQPLPIHAGYAAQPTGMAIPYGLANFSGYTQYMTPNYYMSPPYPGAYPPGGSAYPQAPGGGTYAPTATGSNYPPAGAAKYPVQYKTGGAAAGAPSSGASGAYAAFPGSLNAYGAVPAGSTGNSSTYEDIGSSSQYKDTTLYMPGQQMGRDMGPTTMAGGSFYGVPGGQGQHAATAYGQQAHPGYGASMYHPSQQGPIPSAHQLQQPQGGGLSSSGVSSTQGGNVGGGGGGYGPQQQRSQSWNNNY